MNYNEFSYLTSSSSKEIKAEDLTNQRNRTLLFGNSNDFSHIHIYFGYGEICCLEYFDREFHHYYEGPFRVSILNNVKTVYPEVSDFEFCKLIRLSGQNIPFSCWPPGGSEMHSLIKFRGSFR